MSERRMRCFDRLGDTSGQSWVETVVMLPVIVALLLGLFYLHDLATTRIRAIQAARFVAWESTWYVREDKTNRAMPTGAELKKRLREVGLGRGLKNVDVFRRQVGSFKSDMGAGLEPTFFLPCAVSNLLPGSGACGAGGADQSQGFIGGIASNLSGVLNGLLGLAGDAAFFFQDLMAQNTNWDNEVCPKISVILPICFSVDKVTSISLHFDSNRMNRIEDAV